VKGWSRRLFCPRSPVGTGVPASGRGQSWEGRTTDCHCPPPMNSIATLGSVKTRQVHTGPTAIATRLRFVPARAPKCQSAKAWAVLTEDSRSARLSAAHRFPEHHCRCASTSACSMATRSPALEPQQAAGLAGIFRHGPIAQTGHLNAHGLAVFAIALAQDDRTPGGCHGPFPGQAKCVE
jgi:hypothetical protein